MGNSSFRSLAQVSPSSSLCYLRTAKRKCPGIDRVEPILHRQRMVPCLLPGGTVSFGSGVKFTPLYSKSLGVRGVNKDSRGVPGTRPGGTLVSGGVKFTCPPRTWDKASFDSSTNSVDRSCIVMWLIGAVIWDKSQPEGHKSEFLMKAMRKFSFFLLWIWLKRK